MVLQIAWIRPLLKFGRLIIVYLLPNSSKASKKNPQKKGLFGL